MKAKKYAARIRYLERKIKQLTDKRPDFDFKDTDLMYDVLLHRDLMRQLIEASVDLKFCASTDAVKTCSNCNCWKQNVSIKK